MKRRKILASIAATLPLAGCTSMQAPSKSGVSPENLRSAAEFPLQSEQAGISVNVTSDLTELDAEFTVGVVRGESDSHPPQIGGVFKNTSDKKQKFTFGSDAPLSPTADESPNPKVHLRTPPSDGEYEQDGCWKSPSNAWLSNMVLAELEPGETISNRLDVLGAPDRDTCLPSGTYEFSQPVGRFDTEKEGSLIFTLTLP
ncbi:MAG: hypothetical protein ABEH81_06900 [Halopenitus sp.]